MGKGIKNDREAELWSVFCVSITEVTFHIKICWKSVLLFVMTWCLTYLVSKIKSAYQAKYVTNINEMSTISRLRKHKLKMRIPHGWILLLSIIWMYLHHKIQAHESLFVVHRIDCVPGRVHRVRMMLKLRRLIYLTCVISVQISSQLNNVDATSNWLYSWILKSLFTRFLWFKCCFHTFMINQFAFI